MTTKTTIFTHRPRVSLALFTFCWWHHNRLLMASQWPDHCDAIKWIMISNSLNIDFIHGDIHGWSCKNIAYETFMPVDSLWKQVVRASAGIVQYIPSNMHIACRLLLFVCSGVVSLFVFVSELFSLTHVLQVQFIDTAKSWIVSMSVK